MTVPLARSMFAGAILLLSACSEPAPYFHEGDSPLRLSEWQLFTLDTDRLIPNTASVVFRPNNTLFTDYAHKLRTLWIPEGEQARVVNNEIDYPVGTILSKTFYYPRSEHSSLRRMADGDLREVSLGRNQLLETRLLVRRDGGWDAMPYVWNDEQTEAFLRVAGASKPISLTTLDEAESIDFTYFVPNENQCAGCHTTVHPDGDMHPLGAVYSQLNDQSLALNSPDDTALAKMKARGWIAEETQFPDGASWQDSSAALEERALAYLNMQCGHCHNPAGAADTSGLILDTSPSSAVNRGVCKPPVAAGGGAGNLRYGIVPGEPQQSILLYRMRSTEPDEMMPELGRSLVHEEGIDLISRWISAMPGNCSQ